MNAPIDGIVLAAGRSLRMGAPKAELELDGRTFLRRAVDALREGGCRSVVVVVGERRDAAGPPEDGVVYTLNPDPGSQQVASLRIGLRALPADAAAAAVLPVDIPAVRPDTVRRLLEAFAAGGALAVRPVAGGRPGHPTLFARALFRELSAPGLPRGAESVLEAHPGRIRDVPVDDPGILLDVNTPDDLRRLAGGGPREDA